MISSFRIQMQAEYTEDVMDVGGSQRPMDMVSPSWSRCYKRYRTYCKFLIWLREAETEQ